MTDDLPGQVIFGTDGTDRFHLGTGWSGDELGFRWTVGPQSELWLDNPGTDADCVLEADVLPFVAPPTLPAQRVAVFVRDACVGRTELTGRGRLRFRVPAAILAGPGPVRVMFQHPDAAAPTAHGHDADVRELGLCFERLALRRFQETEGESYTQDGQILTIPDLARLSGEPAERFMLRFESLGDNCEFGLVQRRCGAEPLGLMRFSSISLVDLIRGIEDGFAELGNPANMEFWLNPGHRREYAIRDKSYRLVFHTFLYEGDVDENTLLEQQAARLKFLRRKIIEDLSNGEKVFVLKRGEPLREQEVLPLLSALQKHSGAAHLLYVTVATKANPPGVVQRVAPGLLRGFVDRFAPTEAAQDLSLESWLAVCLRAIQFAGKAAVVTA